MVSNPKDELHAVIIEKELDNQFPPATVEEVSRIFNALSDKGYTIRIEYPHIFIGRSPVNYPPSNCPYCNAEDYGYIRDYKKNILSCGKCGHVIGRR